MSAVEWVGLALNVAQTVAIVVLGFAVYRLYDKRHYGGGE